MSLPAVGRSAGSNHRDTGQTREFIGLARNRNALVHTAELHRTRHLSDDRVCVRIPVATISPAEPLASSCTRIVAP